MRKLLVFSVVLFAAVSTVTAGSIGLSWNASTGATGYEVGVGTSQGAYGITLDVGDALSAVVDVPGGCALSYFAVRAYLDGATRLNSAWSTEISNEARPEVIDATINAGGVHRLQGDNYTDDVEVYVDGATAPVAGLVRASCTEVTIPAAPFVTLTVRNPGQFGDLNTDFSFPLSAPDGFGVN